MKLLQVLVAVSTATAAILKAEDATVAPANFRAFGIGVVNRNKSMEWYHDVLGINRVMTMALGQNPITPWDEDIASFPQYDKRGSQLVIMEWKEKTPRPTKDLPVTLQFTVPNPQKVQALAKEKGGEALDMKSERYPNALYAKDIDGYVLELLPNDKKVSYLSAVRLGTTNLQKKLDWWKKTTAMTESQVQKTKEGDSASLVGDWGAKLEFTTLPEASKTSTVNLPIKVVLSIKDAKKHFASVKENAGRVVVPLEILAVAGFTEDPNDKTFIEVNTGAFGGPP